MLPSKEKFQYYLCPFFLDGNCERPFCHFKHADATEGEREMSPVLNEPEEKCAELCPCNANQTKLHSSNSNGSKHQTNCNREETSSSKKKKLHQTSVPKYRPTPIAELQRRSNTSTADIDNSAPEIIKCKEEVIDNNETYSPDEFNSAPLSLLYNPSDISTLTIKKEEYKPFGFDDSTTVQQYEPSKINLSAGEPRYTPEGSSNSDQLNYEPSDRQLIVKQELEYSPSSGAKSVKNKLEYNPSSCLKIKKILEYNPSSGVGSLGISQSSLDTNSRVSSSDLEKVSPKTAVNYIPTEISKLPISSANNESSANSSNVGNSSKDPTRHKTHTLKHINEKGVKVESINEKGVKVESKNSDKSNDRHKRKRSHKDNSSSSSSSSKRRKSESTADSRKKDTSKKSSTSKVSSTRHVSESRKSREKSASKSTCTKSSSKSSSTSSNHKEHKDVKHSKSSRDKGRQKEKSKHHSSKKSTSKDKLDRKDKHVSKSKDNKSKDAPLKVLEENNALKNIEKVLNSSTVSWLQEDIIQEDTQDASDFDMEDSSDDILQECYRIFEEFEFEDLLTKTQEASTPGQPESQKDQQQITEEGIAVVANKKRIAHETAARRFPPVKSARTIRPVTASAGQMLAQRWKKQQELQLKEKRESETAGSSNVTQLLNQLMDETAKPKPAMSWLKKKDARASEDSSVDERTVPQSLSKGKSRVAHKAREEMLLRPIVSAGPGDKIPCSRRQHALDKFADCCLNIYRTSEEAFAKAIELEKTCFEKSNTHTVYNNLFVNQLLKLKHANNQEIGTGTPNNNNNKQSHEKILMSLDKGVYKKLTMIRNYDFKGPELYKRMVRYKLSEEQLKALSYPTSHKSDPEHGRAQIFKEEKFKPGQPLPDNKRECMRCSVIYRVDKNGMPEELERDELCTFHPKKAYRKRGRYGNSVNSLYYECCGSEMSALTFSSEGCEKNKFHVSENLDYDNLTGFVKTFDKSIPAEKSGIYALDCEMCLTTEGTEVTRITVVNENQDTVYDTLIKPDRPVLDYCTRFSGITEEMMVNINTNLREVQSVLLNLFSKDTILIGHSLNGDLQVLKLIHPTAVDTSIVFPHKEGLPKRRALRNLAMDHLNRHIQIGDHGHDSKEDALACLDLMLMKVKEDAKLE